MSYDESGAAWAASYTSAATKAARSAGSSSERARPRAVSTAGPEKSRPTTWAAPWRAQDRVSSPMWHWRCSSVRPVTSPTSASSKSRRASRPARKASVPEREQEPPQWEQRFRAARVSLPDWAEDAPDRALFVSNATGTYELYAWDRATGKQRQVTDRPNGTTDGVLTPDGRTVWWFADTDGDEFGVWMRQPFEGGPDEPATPGLEPSYPAGLAIGRDGTAVVGRSTDEDGTTVHLVAPGADPVVIYRHRESAGVGDLSHDGTLIALEHTEHGDAMHSALRVVRPDGSTVAELDDTEGGTKELGLAVLGFAPVAGDTRLLVGHQRRGRWEPMIWDPVAGTETALPVDLPGDVGAEWYPDGSALLIEHGFEARSELWRYEPGAPAPVRVETPAGTVSGATARPDGTVEYLWSSAAQPPAVRSTGGSVVLDPPGAKAPASVPVRDAWVDGP